MLRVLAFSLLLIPAKVLVAESPGDEAAARYGEGDTIQYRVGAEITATKGAVRNVVAMVAVPLECPEQEVTILEEEISPTIGSVSYRDLQGGVRQMLISVPFLAAGAEARAVVTFEVTTHVVLPPDETDGLTVPKRLPANMRRFLSGSPYIEVKHNRIRSLAKEIRAGVDESASDWERIEAIYDGVLEKIEYVEGDDKRAIDAVRDGFADCQGRSAVFIAVCRAEKIPARMVWVSGHCYPEFYLEHAAGEGRWYPCESAGSRAFGEMPLTRTVLQKGDNFRVPERQGRLRYASDFLIGVPTPGAGRPKVKYIREEIR